jgi:hypothetical protein
MNGPATRLGISCIGLCLLAIVALFASNRAGAVILAAGDRPSAELAGAWRLVHTPNPRGGPEAVSIMHTADTSMSDLDLAGLMIRCNGGRTELAIVLLRAFPLRAHPRVTFGRPGHERQFEAAVGPPGTALVLPGDPATIISEPWHSESELFIRVVDEQTTVSGVVALEGVQSAFNVLTANCPGS